MRILGLVNNNSGAGMHRILMPLLLMKGIDAYITNAVTEADFDKGCDWIYYNRHTSNNILELRERYNFKVAVDVDDHWELDYHHIAYGDYKINNYTALQIKHLQLADVVTTTHERLAEKIYPYNQNVIICPNAIPNHEYFSFNKTESKKVRLFWQGSITHEKDIELLRNPFKRLDKSKFLMVMAGYTKHEAWDRMVSSYTNGLDLKGSILPGASPFEYYKNYAYADVCLAPLIDSKFNGMKSNLKVLEAAHAGLPVVASCVNPYLGLPVLYVKKQTDWIKHINDLAKSSNLRKELGEELKWHCDTHFNFDKINEIRKQTVFGCEQASLRHVS